MTDARRSVAQQQRAHFATELRAVAEDSLEIIAISAGNGNGWQFTADVLRDSLPL